MTLSRGCIEIEIVRRRITTKISLQVQFACKSLKTRVSMNLEPFTMVHNFVRPSLQGVGGVGGEGEEGGEEDGQAQRRLYLEYNIQRRRCLSYKSERYAELGLLAVVYLIE